jgi:dihydroneopterin aldolase
LSGGICNFPAQMGLIQIENMEFYAFHGHYREEQIVGNKFLVNLSIDSDMTAPATSDNLKDAINYQHAYRLVKEEMEKKSKLLENIAKRILDTIYANFEGVRTVTVKISKMNPPMGGGRIEKVSVTLTR